jgi:uncharacterized alpha-E superfamily protein
MPKKELHKTLQELRVELDRAHFDYEKTPSVESSMSQLEEKLREESFMTGDEYLVHELKEALEEFEEDHPQLTDLVGRISDLLSKIGI